MSTLSAINLKHPSSGSNNIVLDSGGNMTGAGTLAMGSSFLRNRFINGGMVVDQRNAGAARSCSAGAITYVTDRWFLFPSGATLTAQQVTGTNVNSPFAFRITGAVGSTACNFEQRIENLNTNDLANQVVTVSFRVWCSTAVSNASVYAISPTAVNNYASIATSFTTAITLNSGLNIVRVTGTLNSTANLGQAIGIAFNSGIGSGVTVDISDAQVEVGSVATPFERRQYGQELALCQRYYERTGRGAGGAAFSTTFANMFFTFNVTKRVEPTMSLTTTSPVVSHWGIGDRTASGATISGSSIGLNGAYIQINGFSTLTSGTGLNLATDQCIALSAEL